MPPPTARPHCREGTPAAHVLVPPPAPVVRRGPSSSSGSRQRANSARWSLVIWAAGAGGEVAFLLSGPPTPCPRPARSAVHLAILRWPEVLGTCDNALQPLHQLLQREEGAQARVGVGDGGRQRRPEP